MKNTNINITNTNNTNRYKYGELILSKTQRKASQRSTWKISKYFWRIKSKKTAVSSLLK